MFAVVVQAMCRRAVDLLLLSAKKYKAEKHKAEKHEAEKHKGEKRRGRVRSAEKKRKKVSISDSE